MRAEAGGAPVFPLRIPIKGPDSRAMAERFESVRHWIDELIAKGKREGVPVGGYRLEWRAINHRQLGTNRIPVAALFDTEADGLEALGKRREAARFYDSAARIRSAFPVLDAWILKRPLRVLEHADAWPGVLGLLDWVVRHPRPGIYLRQVDVPGVDTKFIERHRALLAEMLDLVLPGTAVDRAFSGLSGFERRYGFRAKSVPVRFRVLDPALRIAGLSDLSVPAEEFAGLSLPANRIFITENEINFLAFPRIADAIGIFGSGYGFDALSQTGWLREKTIAYWGDLDTHGFAILDQLRGAFPDARSLLMDRETLMAHKAMWGKEPHPTGRDLPRLTPDEANLYDDIRLDRIAPSLRLEQERIGYRWVLKALEGFGT